MGIKIAGKNVGDRHPVFIIAEIGINHNGDIDTAKRLIRVAADAGRDAVKFQKRTPHLCVPPEQMKTMRETPWGRINYLQYRFKIEFGEKEFDQISDFCEQTGILWFCSCWDIPSVDFLDRYNPPCYKIPSACFTDHKLLEHIKKRGKPIIASCGMSSEKDIDDFIRISSKNNLILMHTNSSYPAPIEELNLKTISSLREKYSCLVGYSGHEAGLFTTPLAVPLGACCIERHITLDRNMWGTDQSASIEPKGLFKLVEEIRSAEKAIGDGIKKIYPGEEIVRKKLRRELPVREKGEIAAIVQARMGSHRLPGKMLADLAGKPLLSRIIERLKMCKNLKQIIVALPDNKNDDVLENLAGQAQVDIFRGSEDDLISRYLEAAKYFKVDYIVRMPADNPCISPKEIDKIIEFYMATSFDFCSNLYQIQGNGYPDGIGAEIFSREILELVSVKARGGEYREHVHRYFYDNLNVGTIMCPVEYAYPSLKLDVNTEEELRYIRSIYDALAKPENSFFDIEQIVEWHRINHPQSLITPSLKEYRTEKYAIQ